MIYGDFLHLSVRVDRDHNWFCEVVNKCLMLMLLELILYSKLASVGSHQIKRIIREKL